MNKPNTPAVAAPHHFFASTPFNWATGTTRQEAINKVAKAAGADAIRRMGAKGLYTWTAKVLAPINQEYSINHFAPQGVEIAATMEFNIMSVKGYVTLVEAPSA